jgi:hypothetical protein
MPPEPGLLALQRDFMRALREPVFGRSREATALVRRAGTTSAGFERTASRHIRPSVTLEPVERLELYHRQYWFRLLDSLAEDFPALRRLLGESRFWRAVEAYLEATPPGSYTLRHLGAQLAGFLGKHPRLAGPHPVHAIELARLEYALCEAFEQAELPPTPADQLAATPLALQPHLRLFAFRTPADELWRHAESDEPLPRRLLAKAAVVPCHHVAVFRQQLRLRVQRLDENAFRLLKAIAQTGSLDEAIALSRLDADATTLQRVRDWFQLWTSRGWFCARPESAGAISIPISNKTNRRALAAAC